MITELQTQADIDNFTAANRRCVIFYGSAGCGHCHHIAPTYQQLSNQNSAVKFSHMETSNKQVQNLEGVPTFIGYYDGVPVYRVVGANESKLSSMVSQLANLSGDR